MQLKQRLLSGYCLNSYETLKFSPKSGIIIVTKLLFEKQIYGHKELVMDRKERFALMFEAEGSSFISTYIMHKCFDGMSFGEIRNWLEQNDYDRHTMLELRSTEIVIMTPKGIMMQKRTADQGKLGVFGGVLADCEEPKNGAARELLEETGIGVEAEDLQYVGYFKHEHTYTNGDKALFHTYRYVLRLDEVPEPALNYEASGVEFVTSVVSNIIDHQQQFVGDALSGEYDD